MSSKINAKISEIKKVPLSDLTLGKHQARVSDLSKELDDLVESIRAIGLQMPLVVCPSQGDVSEKYEIIAGQRRFLAHKELGLDDVYCSIYDNPLTEVEAKLISLTENVVRTPMVTSDLVDACVYLYNLYGTQKAVVEKTGLSSKVISQYVKFPSLNKQVQTAVLDGEIKLDYAVKSTRALEQVYGEGKAPPEEVIEEAKFLAPLSGAEVKAIESERKNNPNLTVEEAQKKASKIKTFQMSFTLTGSTFKKLDGLAEERGTQSETLAMEFIEDGLSRALSSDD